MGSFWSVYIDFVLYKFFVGFFFEFIVYGDWVFRGVVCY